MDKEKIMSAEVFELEHKFAEEAGINLYTAMQLYFGEYDTEYYCYDRKSLCELDREGLLDTLEDLKNICLKKDALHEKMKDRNIKEFFEISDAKSACPEKARHSSMYTAMMPFINKIELRRLLCLNPTLCWNPYSLMNYPDKDCVCIFHPSERLVKKYPFIKRRYSGSSRVILYYYIDIEELKNFCAKDIEVQPNDIMNFNWRYLHPYHRGLIQNGDFIMLKKSEWVF